MSTALTRQAFLIFFSAVFLPMFLAAVDQTILATATPSIVADLGQLHLSSWIAIGYLLATVATVPIYGWLGDRYGRRNVLVWALGIFCIGSVVGAVASDMTELIMGRVIQGLGGGGLMSLSQALIAELIPPRQRAKYQGYFASMFACASIGGPVIGGLVVTHYTWHWLFWANIPLAMIAAWRLLRLTPKPILEHRNKPIDWVGLLVFPLLCTVFLYWASVGGQDFQWLSLTSLVYWVVFVALGGIFYRNQCRHSTPFLPNHLLVDRAIYIPLLTSLLFAACMFALIFFLPIYLQLGLKTNAATSGLLLLPLTGGQIFGALCSGRIMSKTGVPKWIPVIGMSLSASGFIALGSLPPEPVLIGFLGMLCGIGFGTVMPTTQLVIQTVAGKSNVGTVTALASLSRNLGAATGTALFGVLLYALLPGFDHNTSIEALRSGSHEPVVNAFQTSFYVAAVVAVLAALNAARAPLITLSND
ncbi:MFS transporter [Psychromonas sp. B3M02]|uniref:MDR family MFS transporter n=1 Tax=Psychromonas sp. B3M02 TaxID=2267226 RepID=UPI000DEA0B47|nr:MDR family MFS transporter [Psychromonas sp. B3M02]RBW47018.1 MFS transporter [Psychromonas sp. B3M02]